jgi:hypothetical protein
MILQNLFGIYKSSLFCIGCQAVFWSKLDGDGSVATPKEFIVL